MKLAGVGVPKIRLWVVLALVSLIPVQRAVPAWAALSLVAILALIVAVLEVDRRRSDSPA
jgi:predicted membrane metal-binding protein